MKRPVAIAVVALLCAATAALVVIERSSGGTDYAARQVTSPCTATSDPFPGDGLDATLQRIVLSGLNGAACELGTTREALVLSLAPNSGFTDVDWDELTAERALRQGFERSIDDAEDRGSLPGWGASILRAVVARTPIDWLFNGVDLNPFD